MYISLYVVVNTFIGGRQPQNKLMRLRTFKEKGREHRTTERKRTAAPAEAQGPKQHTQTRPTAGDTPAQSNAQPAHDGKKKKEEREKNTKTGRNTQGGGREKKTRRGGGARRQGPRHPGGEDTKRKRQGGRKKQHKNNHKQGAEQRKSAPRTATGKGEAHQNAPGRLAYPTRQRNHEHAHTHRTRAWRPPLTLKGRCRRPSKTAPVHRPIPRRKTDGTGNWTRQ